MGGGRLWFGSSTIKKTLGKLHVLLIIAFTQQKSLYRVAEIMHNLSAERLKTPGKPHVRK